MKKWILACGIIVIAIMGLQLTAQDVSGAEHINNQVALETCLLYTSPSPRDS